MKVVMTGGGTAGHVMVSRVLMPIMKKDGWEIAYIGSKQGMEKALIKTEADVAYYGISTGKFRRSLTFRHAAECLGFLKGLYGAYRVLRREMPHVVFSGGGYVSVPVVLAARWLRIPVLIRETDFSMGLANRLGKLIAKRIIVTFEPTLKHLSPMQSGYCGVIVRPELLKPAKPEVGTLSVAKKRPVLLIMGGSLGSHAINDAVERNLEKLLKHYEILHLRGRCGKAPNRVCAEGYKSYDYVEDMGSLYAQADVVITRCGSNAICEGLALGKRMILIPLAGRGTRGEQIENARYTVEKGCAVLLEERQLTGETLLIAVQQVLEMPLKDEMKLDLKSLDENCNRQIAELKALAVQSLEERFLRHITHGQAVRWKGLSEEEHQIYEELAAEYWG